MTPERFRQVDRLLNLALEQEPGDRRVFLDQACSGDGELYHEVESLLASDERAVHFLAEPATRLMAELVMDVSTSEAPDAEMAPPSQVGRYAVERELGRGGMGLVYAGHDPELGRKVAIKLLRPEISKTLDASQGKARLLREAQAIAQLSHPNVITVYDVGTVGERVFIAMEYVEGRTLTEWLTDRKRHWSEVLSMFVQAGHGLVAAHDAGIVHRDFKPQNVVVGVDGRARVVDFGLARAAQLDDNTLSDPRDGNGTSVGDASPQRSMLRVALTEQGKFLGTPAYMAPEQLTGQRGDQRTDQFSFCLSLFEGLYGETPFGGESTEALLEQMMRGNVRGAARSRHVPARLRQILSRGLSFDPARRYHSMGALLDELESIGAAPRRLSWTIGLATILALLAVGGVTWQKRHSTLGPIQSIAVLPLINLTGDATQDYFVDGMTEALITDLAQVHALRVISRGSVLAYKGARKPIVDIAKQLNVDAVIEGTVSRVGSRVLFTAQLIDARTERHLWAKTYERDEGEVLVLERELARAIVAEVGVQLRPDERARLASASPVDPQVYQIFLSGQYLLNRETEQGFTQSVAYFETALQKDPEYAPAHAALAMAYLGLLTPMGARSLSVRETIEKARSSAVRALSLDDGLPEAHLALARIKAIHDWDWNGAEQEYRRVLTLNPGHLRACIWYGQHLMDIDRMDEAFDLFQRARNIDPLSPRSYVNLATWFAAVSRFDEGIEQARQALKLDPAFDTAHGWIVDIKLQQGKYDEALRELQSSDPGQKKRTLWALAYAVSKNFAEAERILKRLEQDNETGSSNESYQVARIYSVLGRSDKAFAWLEKALAARAIGIARCLRRDWTLKPLRSDPRFQDLVRRVGVP